MTKSIDGGKANLAGLLYQAVVALGMKAQAHQSGFDEGPDDYSQILTLVGSGPMLLEYLDSDAVVKRQGPEGQEDLVLVQFKYSLQEEKREIRPSELKEIATSFYTSAKRAPAPVQIFVLVSNRALSPHACQLLKQVRQNQTPTGLDSNQVHVLQRLCTVTKQNLNEWENALRAFARSYGAFEDEVTDGIQILTGQMLQRTWDDQSWITRDHLSQAFTRYAQARSLTPEAVIEITRPAIDGIRTQLEIQYPTRPVPRQFYGRMSEECASRALLFLTGWGGCGKTTALWQWGHERTHRTPPREGAFTQIVVARNARRTWITDIICDWARVPIVPGGRRGENEDLAIARLLEANLDLPRPILQLGLDGLDEGITGPDDRINIHSIMNWFWQEDIKARQELRSPRASLVVTLRATDERSIKTAMYRFLDINWSELTYEERPSIVRVDEFVDEELREAIRLNAPALVERIDNILRSPAPPGIGAIGERHRPQFFAAEEPRGRDVDRGIVEALRHPAMLRCFLRLSQVDQTGIVDGSPDCVQALAQEFMRWFDNKIARRRYHLYERIPPQLLPYIAYLSMRNDQERFSNPRDWIKPAYDIRVAEGDASELFDEAVTAGLIRQDEANYWYWHHRFVADYLAHLYVERERGDA